MKLSDYIKNLENILENNGDNELHFEVTDSYDRYGSEAGTTLNTEKNTLWDGVRTNGNVTTIKFFLKSKEGKNPKITFRK